jgi:hypothetical protein
MATATPSTALATIKPASTDPERLALAGFLAGFRGLTRDAYAQGLRQLTSWCRVQSLALFAVCRADIESFARELEARGRARAPHNHPPPQPCQLAPRISRYLLPTSTCARGRYTGIGGRGPGQLDDPRQDGQGHGRRHGPG